MQKNVLFIGAGKLGTTLARAMHENGISILYFLSKDIILEHGRFLPKTKFIRQLNKSAFDKINTIIITVPDDQIKNVVNKLKRVDINWEGIIVFHTSGCLSSEKLKSLSARGAFVGSVHPMQTFDDYFLPPAIFKNITFTIEGDHHVYNFVEKITEILSANILKLNAESKVLYHIAAVASSNFFTALLDYSSGLYKELNFDEKAIKKLILPIVNQSLINFEKNNSKDSLTGPLKRGDWNTIESHVHYLKKNQNSYLPIYKEISNYISRFILNMKKSDLEKLNKIFKNTND
jgi:predicted short-subunit dehydrogenase-like oxidoreductase (DUF2520 family)